MYLDEIVAAQKRGEARGIPSVCSAHPWVLKETLKGAQTFGVPPLIEATCNQVNQFGGYTGMNPADFAAYVRGLADEVNFPFEQIILGGDHLGPSVWQGEPAEAAMRKAEELVRRYVEAGFTKIHLDCSMKLADDPDGALSMETSAQRAARLAKVAEDCGVEYHSALRYIIGTEVPIPGGATEHEEGVSVTKAGDARQTVEVTREAFQRAGSASAWERVVGVVVQPGVEFGDDFVLPYRAEAARELSRFIESQPMVYEAHSTDYQTREALADLVRDHFAILKVGPGLTFAYREAVFALAAIEDELVEEERRSNIVQTLDDVMLKHPEHWKKYYHGTQAEQAFKRKFSLSDRVRYYWTRAEAQSALERLMTNLGERPLPNAFLNRFVGREDLSAAQVIERKLKLTLDDYFNACEGRGQP